MKIDVKSLDNVVVGNVELPADVFEVLPRKDILHRVVLWQLAKRRAGTHATKTISEISGTTKKPYSQKGTGRARQGSTRSPQMRGGGVSFGPVVRDHGYSLQKKVRSAGLKMALSLKVADKKLIVLDGVSLDGYNTKLVFEKLTAMGLERPLFVVRKDENKFFVSSVRNLVHTDVLPVEGINVYDILKHRNLVITADGLKGVISRFMKSV